MIVNGQELIFKIYVYTYTLQIILKNLNIQVIKLIRIYCEILDNQASDILEIFQRAKPY